MNYDPNAPGDRPSGRGRGLALGRGIVLLAVALVIGIVLLRSVPTPVPPGPVTATTVTTAAPLRKKPVAKGPTTTVPTLAPSKVAVLVANGTTVPSGAGNLAVALKALGYDTLPAYDTTAPATASAVYYVSATYKQPAATLAGLLGLPSSAVGLLPSSAPVPKVSGYDVAIVEGPHLAARFANPTSLGTTTTSTPGTTSTTGTTRTTGTTGG